MYEAGHALNCLANICRFDIARDLVADVVTLLSQYAHAMGLHSILSHRFLFCSFFLFLSFLLLLFGSYIVLLRELMMVSVYVFWSSLFRFFRSPFFCFVPIFSFSHVLSSRSYLRKKSTLVMYKLYLKYPDALRPTFQRLKEKLEDEDPCM
jgi:hypothetical protein